MFYRYVLAFKLLGKKKVSPEEPATATTITISSREDASSKDDSPTNSATSLFTNDGARQG